MNLMLIKKNYFLWMVFLSGFCTVYSNIIAVDRYKRTKTFTDSQLNFIHPIKGAIVAADPIDACNNISAPPFHNFNYSLNWFALIREGGCNIIEKVFKAYIAGYSAAVICNNGATKFVLPPSIIINPFISYPNITVVVIDESSAENILKKFSFSVDPESRILILPNQFHHVLLAYLKQFALLLMLILFTCITFTVPIAIVRYVHQTWQSRTNRLSIRDLKHLEITRYKQGDPYETCAICLEDYKEKDKLRILPCSHGYHCKCIDPWIINNRRTCPVCKQKINLPGIHSDEDSSSDTESRAETTPLLSETVRRQVSHGTFPSNQSISSSIFNSSSNATGTHINQVDSGETTSQDAPSLSDINEIIKTRSLACKDFLERHASHIRPSSSVPDILTATAADNTTLTQENMENSEPCVAISRVSDCNVVQQSLVTSNSLVDNSSPQSNECNKFKPYVV